MLDSCSDAKHPSASEQPSSSLGPSDIDHQKLKLKLTIPHPHPHPHPHPIPSPSAGSPISAVATATPSLGRSIDAPQTPDTLERSPATAQFSAGFTKSTKPLNPVQRESFDRLKHLVENRCRSDPLWEAERTWLLGDRSSNDGCLRALIVRGRSPHNILKSLERGVRRRRDAAFERGEPRESEPPFAQPTDLSRSAPERPPGASSLARARSSSVDPSAATAAAAAVAAHRQPDFHRSIALSLHSDRSRNRSARPIGSLATLTAASLIIHPVALTSTGSVAPSSLLRAW